MTGLLTFASSTCKRAGEWREESTREAGCIVDDVVELLGEESICCRSTVAGGIVSDRNHVGRNHYIVFTPHCPKWIESGK